MDDSRLSLSQVLWQSVLSTLTAAFLVSLVLWFPFKNLNEIVSLSDSSLLFGYLLAFHLALLGSVGLPAALIAWQFGRPTADALGVRGIRLCTAAAELGLLLALNSAWRFTLTYTFFRVRGSHFMTPLGLINLVVFGAAVPILAYAVYRAGSSRGNAGSALRPFGIWLVVYLAIVVWNLRSEVPPLMDLGRMQIAADAVSSPGAPSRVLLLGFDGMEWHVIDELTGRGELPNFQALLQRGARANMRTMLPTDSPIIWNTIATSRDPADHGVHGNLRFKLPGMIGEIGRGPDFDISNWWNAIDVVLSAAWARGWIGQGYFSSSDRKVAPLWDIADHYGVATGMTNWYTSWPVHEPASGGYQATKLTDERPSARFPKQEVDATIAAVQPPELPVPSSSQLLSTPHMVGHINRSHFSVYAAMDLIKHFQPRLAMHYTHVPDSTHHRFWRGKDPGFLQLSGEHVGPDYEQSIVDAYRLLDSWLGDFVATVPSDTLIIVISDHGFAFDGHGHFHAPPAVFMAAGPGVPAGAVLEDVSIYDVTPTILAALGLPVSQELVGRVVTDLQEPGALAVVKTVAAYDWYQPHDPEAVTTREDLDKEEFERLRTLGYVR